MTTEQNMPRPRVLIVYGSKRGGTEGLATMIADVLADNGCDVHVSPADYAPDLDSVDGVIVAGALYANRWHPDARRFVRHHAARLRQKRVWLISSGPLDESADAGQLAATRQISRLSGRIDAMGTVTFGGRLTSDARGLIARRMANTRAGDWRNPAQVRAFGELVTRRLRYALAAESRHKSSSAAGS